MKLVRGERCFLDTLPPVKDSVALLRRLRAVPARRRDDAIQEAWLAHLEGRDVIQAISTFNTREWRHEKRQVPISAKDSEQGNTTIGYGKRRRSTLGLSSDDD